MRRYQAIAEQSTEDPDLPWLITLDNVQDYTTLTPSSITFNIYLPTGAIGTLSNFTPRGFVTTSSLSTTKGLMVMNRRTNSTGLPNTNRAQVLDLSSIFTEVIDTVTLDACLSNDSNRSSSDLSKAGPDFYLESKQYNFGESTLRKWWRKMLFNLRINNGYMMVEFFEINNTSLVDVVTGESFVRNDDESGYFLIPSTNLNWGAYEETSLTWAEVEASGLTWGEYFGNKIIRYSRWLGIRQNSLGFKFYSLHGFEGGTGSEILPELVAINDWVFGLKPLRKGRN